MTPRDRPVLDDSALASFESLFRRWLEENLDRLEAGSAGDLEGLAQDCLEWAKTAR